MDENKRIDAEEINENEEENQESQNPTQANENEAEESENQESQNTSQEQQEQSANEEEDQNRNDETTTNIPVISTVSVEQPKEIKTSNGGKFMLLMWKNWRLQRRKRVQTVMEILVPILLTLLLVLIGSTITMESHDSKVFEPFDVSSFPASLATVILYSPDTKDTSAVMDIFRITKTLNVTASDDIVNDYRKQENEVFFAVVFPSNFATKDEDISLSIRFPSELKFTQDTKEDSWKTYSNYPLDAKQGPRNHEENTGATPNYFKEQFIQAQSMLTVSLIAAKKNIPIDIDFHKMMEGISGDTGIPVVKMQRFPYPPWKESPILEQLKTSLSLMIMLGFIYSCINIVKMITNEKENQLKEAMKIMGLSNWLHWTAWFVKSLIFLLISCIIIVILFKINIFVRADPSVMLLFLSFYASSIVMFCFAVSVFFSRADTAAAVAGLLWFISFMPYLMLQDQNDRLSLAEKMAAALAHNSAMGYGFETMLKYEAVDEGIAWTNMHLPPTPDENLTLLHVIVMLLVDSLLYFLIAMYFEAIFPGEYGLARPFYFPFTSSYWFGQPRNTGTANHELSNATQDEFFEKPPDNLKAGVEIRNLRKVYKSNVAVENLSLDMYQNQITVLLGHNGAGKTTTICMLTGMIPSTSGTAVINGYDIRTQTKRVRDSLGLCPQHDILFDELTVADHIYFYSRLKGMRKKDITNEIDRYVSMLEFQDKKNAKSKTLSGGMKRKLSVAIAFCGNSKVVMLDEPTSGMDPSARRSLWKLIQTQKNGRTILLTTHFMDEADLLGDRIAIMSRGVLKCCGSSFFLKKKFGAGYHLILDKSENCDVEKVTDLLRNHIPEIEVHSNVGSELTYLLDEDEAPKFEEMLKDLEEHQEELGVNGYGISMPTLEEIFLKVGSDQVNNSESQEVTVHISYTGERRKGFKLTRNQFRAMFMKKFLSSIRSWIILLIQILLPIIFLLQILIANYMSGRQQLALPELKLNLDNFASPKTIVQVDDESPYSNTFLDIVGRESEIEKTKDITDTALRLREENNKEFKFHYVVGAYFEKKDKQSIINVYFNNDPYHSPGIASSLAWETVYKVLLNCSHCSLKFANHPLPYSTKTMMNQLMLNSFGSQLAFQVGYGLAFSVPIFILFVIRERTSKSKHLQLVSGVEVWIFWITTFLYDFLIYLFIVVLFVTLLSCFQTEGLSKPADLGRLVAIMLCFGVAVLPLLYCFGFCFEVPSTGYTKMVIISFFTGAMAVLLAQMYGALGFKTISDVFHYVLMISPFFALSEGILHMSMLYDKNRACSEWAKHGVDIDVMAFCKDSGDDYFRLERPGIGYNVLVLLLLGSILLLALFLYDYQIVKDVGMSSGPVEVPDEDSDVYEEKRKVRNATEDLIKANTLVMKDVTKYYKKKLAVNGLCLAAKGYECFGLLGVNGAGKTTTFRMLTGDLKMSHGDAWINGKSIRSDLKNVRKHVGYCPQFDALLDNLTARETLKMYALIRGVPEKECRELVDGLARDFDFSRHLDKKVKQLSGGNKRKLSTAVSSIGDPSVIYLDEPTTGMDPATRRFLWDALCKLRDNGKLIILTSHSMEECEALCTRLAIMVNGNFKCIGSGQHLKNKFAKGYTLTIKVKKPPESDGLERGDTQPIEDFVGDKFPMATLRERHQELLTYYIADTTDIPVSRMFGILEEAKHNDALNIEDYSLGQSSLEQVFLTFAKYQE
ncbi:unnamed protein product [Brassicogethes aeneus]|uniref:ABC transporter domain-containing protein n=1 Tax=Brassicogethes aeneus TaxID=1431903 RepID=A0A9P0FBP4_BRAAE|nr:unnamed protein product [Brassicogethes aeneus]